MGADADSPNIQQAFLVHKSGCLVAYKSAEVGEESDYDIFAGMLTAIQSFVKDTFGGGEWSLKRLEFEDRKIFIELGDYIYLAIVYSGMSDTKMQTKLERTVDIIEEKFWGACRDWSGDMDEWEGCREILSPLFTQEWEELEDEGPKCELCGAVIQDLDIVCPVCGYDSAMYN
ncbi:MAG: hypothetical protein KAX31_03785 [Thermoplasmata archaeon]|nr:hypothetical protein [Thermoplasmata archaeon]